MDITVIHTLIVSNILNHLAAPEHRDQIWERALYKHGRDKQLNHLNRDVDAERRKMMSFELSVCDYLM